MQVIWRLHLIIKIREELGATTITITHDMESTRQIAQDVAFLYDGKFIWSGEINEMQKTDNPYVQQFINGRTDGPIVAN